jgi:isopenicillin N synthase-like dioxygenase
VTLSVVDLAAHRSLGGAARRDSATRLDAICRTTGFLVLTGHEVPQSVIDAMRAAVAAFFDLPRAQKQRLVPAPGDPYGWIGVGSEALARSRGDDTPPDLKESFNGGPLTVPRDAPPDALEFCYRPTPWPDVPGFRRAWEAYYREMEQLAGRIMSLMAEALGLPEHHFAPMIGAPVSALRALRYPPTGDAAAPGQERAGAHSDYGSLTILLPGPGARGLEIHHDGAWSEVVAPPDAFVVNIGDLMARWTSDRWISTLHRVAFRPNQPVRESLAFFHQPDWDAEIRPLDGSDAWPVVRSGPYLMDKFRSTGT